MGRHSIPGPDDSADDHQDPGRPGPEPDEPIGFGYGTEPDEPGDDGFFADNGDGFAADEPPTRALTTTGSQRTWDSGEWTGSHRAITPGRRKVSPAVIAALVAVVVIVGAFILWRFFGDALSSRSQQAAARCVEGEVTVAVLADPTIADQVRTLADTYSKSAAPVGDKCVKVAVQPANPDDVINGFVGQWPGDLGERPALWIPASSVSESRLESAAGAKTVSNSRPLVTSPVLLAMRPELKAAMAQQNWSTLSALQNNPSGLDDLNLRGWGALKLALPLTGNGDATYLAAEAVAAASAPQGAPATAGVNAVQTLLSGQPKLANTDAVTALDALVNAPDPAAAPVHAVVTTEQQLFARGADLPDAAQKLGSWTPPGPAAIADYPAVLLGGDWLSQEQIGAASEFDRFMRKPDQLAQFAKAGFRAEGQPAPQSPVTDFAPVGQPLSVGDSETRATMAAGLSAPAEGQTVTVMLDQSMNTDEGGKSRLANVATTLGARLQALPANSAVGLWTFDGVSGRSEVSTGPVGDQVGGQPRSAVLKSSLDEQSASGGGAVSFTTLRLVYGDAVAAFREGQPNSVLVITAGPHTDQSLDGTGLVDFIKGAANPARPVAVNVINFGNDPDRATWEAVAQASGGQYQNVPSSAGPELAAALASMVG
ncbi:MAG: hypothetical protein HYZ39_13265 [Mycolicibacterium cosmeticum]|nr:hypothetical protein [Mycolicibacterium cosmeticum]